MSDLTEEAYRALKERFSEPPNPPAHIQPEYVENWRREWMRIPAMILRVYAGGLPNPGSVYDDFWEALGPEGQAIWRESWRRHDEFFNPPTS